MNVEFSLSKDGNKTFCADKVFFHSTYSPEKEAQRFVDSTDFPYNPKIIFFIEPGLSYCAPLLKKRYPVAKIICLRLFDKSISFSDEAEWDAVIPLDAARLESLNQFLIDTFGEEKLLSSALLIWKPAQNLFEQQIQIFIKEYKQTLEECKTLLVTRQFFEKKWLLNSCSFISNIKKQISKNRIKTEKPVVVCASGPSLKPCIPILKQNTDKLFIICLSSAVPVLLNNSIIPDIVLTTDGGYWAGEHLKELKKHNDITLAAPVEAFIPKVILRKNPVITLKYNDSSSFISNSIIEKSGLNSFEAVRNPTVSGTAFYFANSITTGKVYFLGLDLNGQKGFQHSQPNEIEKDNSIFDTRIKPNTQRNTASYLNSGSLKIYQNWFMGLPANETGRTVRVIDGELKNNSLGNIKDISSTEFEKELEQGNCLSKHETFSFEEYSPANKSEIFEYILSSLKTQKWQAQLFPADFISINNCISEEEKQKAQERLEEKVKLLEHKIRKLADD